MFSHCEGLISLELNNFDLSNVIEMSKLFEYCISLISLDFTKFDTSIKSGINMDNIFDGFFSNAIFCIDNIKNAAIIIQLSSKISDYKNNCSDISFHELKRLTLDENSKVICKLDCIYNEINIFEYNNICYPFRPNGTHNSTTIK